jgi:hypothetical protein
VTLYIALADICQVLGVFFFFFVKGEVTCTASGCSALYHLSSEGTKPQHAELTSKRKGKEKNEGFFRLLSRRIRGA